MHKNLKLAMLILAGALMSAPAHATPIVGTGEGVSPGNPEPALAWTVSPSLPLTVVSDECCFGGAWVNPVGLTANWITPYANSPGNTLATNDPTANDANALYLYTLVFDNPNRDVTINWATDNDANFLFNTVSQDQTGISDFGGLRSFTIPMGAFLASNTFTVEVTNRQFSLSEGPANPTGLYVDVGRTTAVPTPASLPLFAAGLGLMALFAWRRRREGNRA
jgi:MYXO-CTERM domain-containing protein